MKIKIKFERHEYEKRRNLVHALMDAGFQVDVENSPRYLDGRVYVHVTDDRIEPD